MYELSATVIHLVASHAFAADISVRFAGKSYHRDGEKIEMPRRMSFRGLRTSLSLVTRGRDIGMKKGREEKKKFFSTST